MVPAVRETGRPCIFVGNIMTQPGETTGFTLADHVAAFERHAGSGFLRAILACSSSIPEPILDRYRKQGAEPVALHGTSIGDIPIFAADLADGDQVVRHNPERLARHLLDVYSWLST